MLVQMSKILEKASKENYAVAAANVWSAESVLKCYEAAYELKSPFIINVSPFVKDMEWIAEAAKFFERKYPQVPMAINLDHGQGYDMAAKCIKYGFTSVMIDKSSLPFDENVRLTKEVADMAHAAGVSIEGEIGHVGGMGFCTSDGTNDIQFAYDDNEMLTTPEEALEYIKKTNVDCVAVAVGTVHGEYTKKPQLDFERCKKIKDTVGIPLVLHGASYTGDENLQKFIANGINKINLFSELQLEAVDYVKAYMAEDSSPKIFILDDRALEGYKEKVKHFMKVFGQENRW